MRRQAQYPLQEYPVETISRVGFSSGRHMFVTGNISDRIVLQDGRAKTCQCFILMVFKVAAFDTFELDADRVVVAVAVT